MEVFLLPPPNDASEKALTPLACQPRKGAVVDRNRPAVVVNRNRPTVENPRNQ